MGNRVGSSAAEFIYFPGGQAISGERVLSGAIEAWSAGMNLLYRTEPRAAF